MKKDKWLVLRVDVDWLERLRRLASEDGVSCSEYIRRLLDECKVKKDLTD